MSSVSLPMEVGYMKFLMIPLPIRTFCSSKTPQVSACPLYQIKLALLWNFDTADSGGGEVFFRFQVFVLLSFCFVESTQSSPDRLSRFTSLACRRLVLVRVLRVIRA